MVEKTHWLQRYAHYLKMDAMLSSSEKVGVEPFSILFWNVA